jgi:lipoprotein-anchoring transpeptidase ErfK/SrfK
MSAHGIPRLAIAFALLVSAAAVAPALGEPLSYGPVDRFGAIFVVPPQPQRPVEEADGAAELPAHLRRQVVSYPTSEAAGTVIIDTAHTYLYLTLGGGKAIRYGIGVGRDGFTWSGVQPISRKAEWPDWIPPAEMIARQPYLPRWVGGGPGNPLGARALYLGHSAYRIHGTNDPTSIGKHVSSGCIRMRNEDVVDLYERVSVGSKVVVLPDAPRRATAPARREQVAASEEASAQAVAMRPVVLTGQPVRAFGLY